MTNPIGYRAEYAARDVHLSLSRWLGTIVSGEMELRMSAFRVALILAAGLIVSSPTFSRTWYILNDGSGDAPTVQAGIDSAATGDTVLVAPGTYYERLLFRGRNIVVCSSAGPAQTILDGGNLAHVVTFKSRESRATVLKGFTITHGKGGIVMIDSQPSIIGNTITHNDDIQNGGGIWCGASTNYPWYPLIQGNTITYNWASNLAGGVGTLQKMVPDIIDNYIAENETRDGDGAGIYYASFDNGAVIRNNVVLNNRAGDHGGGIYVGNLGGTYTLLGVEVSWNLISGNYAHGSAPLTPNSGGGLWLLGTDAWVHHNTIVGNTGDGPNNTYGGGGIVMEQPGSPIIEQNIIAFSTKGGGIWCGGGATPTIRNNLAWQNVGGDGVKDCPNWWQSDGNVVDNPYFCDMASGDFTVASNSGVITHPAGPLGAFSTPGCGPVAVQLSTWGALKARYH
jgi:parallel beta helix pectate lyase-like protein